VVRLDAGASISSSEMTRGGKRFAHWARSTLSPAGLPPRDDFDAQGLGFALAEEGEKVAGEAWSAIHHSAPSGARWFPAGVPVVLAQIEGGAGTERDSGVRVDRDIMVVRVVGWGGEAP